MHDVKVVRVGACNLLQIFCSIASTHGMPLPPHPEAAVMCHHSNADILTLELTMPALSPTMSQGNIAAWQVKEGDEVVPGDVLCDVETDKATMAWENQDEGFVARILLPDGAQNVPIGTPALLLVDDASDIAAFKDYDSPAAGSAGVEGSLSISKESAEPSAPDTGSGPPEQAAPLVHRSSKMGPAAQLLLQGSGLAAADITPTGPGGIITKADVLISISSGTKPREAAQPLLPPQQEAPPVPRAEERKQAVSKGGVEVAEVAKERSVAAVVSPAAPQRQLVDRVQPSRGGPDWKLRAIVAEKMLQQGQRIPDAWLRDWVGAPKSTAA